MTSEDSDGSPSSFPLDPCEEISLWLSSLHLSQYASSFTQAGYHTLEDCRGLTEEKLLQVAHFPTGHRRRILHNLEVFVAGDNEEGKKKPVPFARTIFQKGPKRVTSSSNLQASSTGENNRLPESQNLPARTCKEKALKHDPGFISPASLTLPRTNQKASTSASRSDSLANSKESLSASSHSLPSDWDDFLKEANPSIAQPVSGVKVDFDSTGFQGLMVDNDIYESSQFTASGTRPTRSYKLRHRPVPEIPEHTIIPSHDW